MADLATLQQRLDDAETAYHRLRIGGLAVEVQHGDMRKKYTESNANELWAYILDLRAQVAAAGGTITTQRRRGIVVDL